MLGFVGAIASATRPTPAGRNVHGPLISVQVSPASVERYMPLVAALKRTPIPAYIRVKFVGSTSRSVPSPMRNPDRSTDNVGPFCDQVTPPSVDLKIPRGGTDGGLSVGSTPTSP